MNAAILFRAPRSLSKGGRSKIDFGAKSVQASFTMQQIASRDSGGTTGRWTPYFVSSDPRETSEIVGQSIISHSLAHDSREKRPAMVRFRTASLGTLTFHEMAYSMIGEGEVRINVPNMANIYLCEINLAGQMAVGQMRADRAFRPGEIYMINANGPHTKVWQTDGRQMMIKTHQTDMEAALERRIGMPVRDPLVFDQTPCPLSGGVATLGKMIDLLAQDLELEGSFFGGAGSGDAKQMLLDMMLNALPHNYTHLLSDTSLTLRPRHVRHAAAYIHSHSREVVGLDDMVRASGVSRRSLHAGFRKYYGVTPMVYLRNVRLDNARLVLKQQGVGNVSVTEVALDCGFNHLSKFAQAYKERFGALPSGTLRNA
jgi:AraC-like DNA-binding protein